MRPCVSYQVIWDSKCFYYWGVRGNFLSQDAGRVQDEHGEQGVHREGADDESLSQLVPSLDNARIHREILQSGTIYFGLALWDARLDADLDATLDWRD